MIEAKGAATASDVESGEARAARGKAARALVPFEVHSEWTPAPGRPSPVDLLEEQARSRIAELVPIRHGRMLASHFSYFRGAALPMAADLATTPDAGITVQACGDAHLSNFGFFGSPERHLVFDVNDFDETAPAPWEWDVKRLAASLEVAARDNDFHKKERLTIVRGAVRAYREAMHELARLSMMEVWYRHLDFDRLLPQFEALLDPDRTPAVWHAVMKARAHDSHQAYDKLCRHDGDTVRIISDPPLITPVEDFGSDVDPAGLEASMRTLLTAYTETLEGDRRHLLEQFRLVHLARKVVGVGSVGTDCWIALLTDRDHAAPLFLQVKEAQPAVLEAFSAPSEFDNHGERVVAGQRLMQTTADIFLGWTCFDWQHGLRDYYVRQLRDWKGSAVIGLMTPEGMSLWGSMCGWTLARAHARSGDRIAIAAYLGKSDGFDNAIAEFAVAYADQNERDYDELREAVTAGRLQASSVG